MTTNLKDLKFLGHGQGWPVPENNRSIMLRYRDELTQWAVPISWDFATII